MLAASSLTRPQGELSLSAATVRTQQARIEAGETPSVVLFVHGDSPRPLDDP